jgi:hypothetical protein
VSLPRPAYPGSTVAGLASVVAAFVGYGVWRWLVARDARRAVTATATAG